MSEFDDELSTYFRTRLDPTPPPVASFIVSVVSGPDMGARWLVDETGSGRVFVGTSPVCQVRLRDREVSRRHAAFEVEDTRLRVVDQETTNGTWLGATKIGEVWLTGGEHLRVGATVLRFECGPPPEEPLGTETHFGPLIGASREMRRLYGFVRGVAHAAHPVVIEGEPGTGKELLAEAIHLAGPRASGPFVLLDCAAMAAESADLELFGRESGGHVETGLLEQASGGTLFIDELAELDPSVQAKLVGALERRQFRRVSSDRVVQFGARLLVASRRDLDREVQAGRLSEDLYHLIGETRLELPPLRKRRGDIPLLAAHLCRELGGDPAHLPARIVAGWESLSWPGNVRELRNAVARFLTIGELAGRDGGREDSAMEMIDPPGDWLGAILAKQPTLAEAREHVLRVFERRYVEVMLEAFDGNIGRASTAAGIARRYFQMLNARRKQ